MTTIELAGRDGLRLAADVLGPEDGKPVVLLHGGGQTRHAWGTTLEAVAERGWRGYSVDLRGHGDSEWDPEGDYTLHAFAADVAAVARALDEPPVLIGASLGGISSLIAVAEGAPARGIVLVDIAPRIEQDGVARIGDFMTAHLDGFASLEEVADAVAAYNPHRPRPTNLEGLRKNVRQREDGRWYWHWDPAFVSGRFGSTDETRAAHADPNLLRNAARSLRIPTMLVRGRMSDLLSEEGAKEMLELVPHARFADVAGAGHMVAGDRNDLFNDAVLSFLEELPDGATEVRGVVEHGDARGRAIGFPTANVAVAGGTVLPRNGVYAGYYTRPNGEEHIAAINIGRRPTFYDDNGLLLVEAHLLDFDGDLYGEEATVRFVARLRDEVRFDGIDALKAQLRRDVEATRELLGRR